MYSNNFRYVYAFRNDRFQSVQLKANSLVIVRVAIFMSKAFFSISHISALITIYIPEDYIDYIAEEILLSFNIS